MNEEEDPRYSELVAAASAVANRVTSSVTARHCVGVSLSEIHRCHARTPLIPSVSALVVNILTL